MTAGRLFRWAIAIVAPFFLWVNLSLQASAGEVRVAVAANFTSVAHQIAEEFEAQTGHIAILSFGATGQLYSQITQGAPYDLFLAADHLHPHMIHEQGLGAGPPPTTYAIGKLALWSLDPALIQGDNALRTGNFDHLAIANPETAPYGKAAVETMQALGLFETLEPKLVRGNNIAQTFQFIATGNAEIGFVALSQIAENNNGSRWLVPENLYQPIRQDAVLLENGADNPAAIAFLDHLASPAARRLIEKFGYATSSVEQTE